MSIFVALLFTLEACSPRHLIIHSVADELAQQSEVQEDDLQLAKDAGAFYLKLSESVLRQVPAHRQLSEAVAAGFTQYAFAFVASEAEQVEVKDAKSAHALRQRAAALYRRGNAHAMAALEWQTPGFLKKLSSGLQADWPRIAPEQVGLAYWAAASWGGLISLSKDDPDTLADLPVALRLAQLAFAADPAYGQGALASLMGTFEAARPGGSIDKAASLFDRALAISHRSDPGILVAKAEAIALPSGDRAGFERLLREALQLPGQPNLQKRVMQKRAQWLLDTADDLF